MQLVRVEQTIHGAHRAPIADWSRVLAFMTRNEARVRAMVTHRLPLAGAMRS